jgi:hypothetical protein
MTSFLPFLVSSLSIAPQALTYRGMHLAVRRAASSAVYIDWWIVSRFCKDVLGGICGHHWWIILVVCKAFRSVRQP